MEKFDVDIVRALQASLDLCEMSYAMASGRSKCEAHLQMDFTKIPMRNLEHAVLEIT